MNVLEGPTPSSLPQRNSNRVWPWEEGSSVITGVYRVRFARAGVSGLSALVICSLISARD